MIGRRRNRSLTAIIVALIFTVSMLIGVLPVQAADITVELLSPASTWESEVGTTVTYQVNQKMDSNNIVFQWNFDKGIDNNLETNIALVTLSEVGGDSIVLDSSDFTYSRPDTLRLLELSTSLEPGKDYTVTLGAAIVANNGTDSLGKDYVWKFSTAAAGVAEITAFDAVPDVNAGTAGSAAYADAAAVQAVLPDSVTANAGAVTVPVTAWEDTDLYDPAAAGSYTFTAVLGTIPDGYANTGGFTATAEVIVEAASTADTTPPDIVLLGNATINLTVGDTFTEPGYTAIDDVDGDITDNVVVGGDTVDTNAAGTYVITYNVSDAVGNAADEATRTVTVSEKVSTPYTAQQGIGAFQLMLTSVAADDIEVKEATDTYYANVIKTTYDPSSEINFDITITGSGGNTYPLATAVTRVFPYIKILNAAKTNVAAEYNNGTGALKCNETAVAPSGNGTTFKMVLDADTLASNTQYYLYIDPDLQNKQPTPIKFGKSIYFEFKTGAATPSAPYWESGAALTLSDVTGTGFNLSWPEASGAEAYKVIVSNTTGGVITNALYTTISEGTACAVTGLTANRHYDIKVTATNITGDSPASLAALAVTTPDKTLFTFVSGVPNSTDRYGFMPSGTVASETTFEKVYTYNGTLDSVNTRFFWYLQAGFNNTNARDHVNSFRLFDLTDNEEIALDYGTTNFGLGTGGWTASGITESDTGYTLISEMTSGDFKVAKIQPSSVWIRFELDIAKYLEAGKEYAITIDPQFHTGGANPTVLGKIYSFAFTTSTPDTQYPTWGSGAAITASDITTSGFTVSYPAANDNVGVVKYNIVLKQGSETVSSESITGLSKVFTGLDEATDYTVSVNAEDAAGNKSAVLSTQVSTIRAVPTWSADAELLVSNVMATDVTINWPYSNTPELVAGYALFVNGTETERFLPNDYYCELGGLLSSTKYIFELKPFNAQGEFGEAISAMAVTDGAAVLSFTTTFAVEEIAAGEYYRNYLVKYPLDLANFTLGWNFSNGVDTHLEKNLAGIRVYEKDTGTEIVLDKGTAPYAADTDGTLMAGDFMYTKSGGGDQGTGTETKIRLLLFKPSAATLAQFTPGKEYVLEMQPDLISNNGENTLSKITTFAFSVSPDDSEAPVWPAEAELVADKTGPESIAVIWPAALDNLILKEYRLAVNGAPTAVIDAEAATAYKLTGLTPDTAYNISVVAVDAKNNQSDPLQISVRTLLEDATAPTWPVGSALTVKNIAVDNADLLWTAADDNVDVNSYQIYNGNVLLAETNALQLHITGLLPATTYIFRIEAVDEAGNISSTGPVKIISTLEGTPDTEAPLWNGGGSHSYSITGDYSNTYVTINWPWATDNVAVREYQVYLEGELIAAVSSIANSYSGTLPLDGSYHNYEVYACDASGNVSAQPQSFSILAGQLPDDLVAPYWPAGNEIIISDFTDKTAVISWSEAADNKAVTAYLLKRDQLWVVWVDQTENYPGYMSFEDRTIWYDLDKLYPLNLTYKHPRENLELVEGEPYSCSMKAFDALGNSSIGGPKITFYPGTDPTAGSGIEFALSNVKNSRGTLSSLTGAMNLVDDPTDPELTKLVFDFACKLPANYADGISLYDKATGVQVALAPENFIYAENGETSQLTIDPGVLTAESTYVVKFSKDFSSSAGAAIGFDLGWEFTTAKADKEIPAWGDGAALDVAFLISPMTATLSWPAAIDNLQVTQYKVFKGDEVLAVLPGETREYLAQDLSAAAEYTFKVQAGDYLNNWSTLLEKAVTSPAADITPPEWRTGTLSFTNINSDNVTLNWSAASGEYAVKDYLIYKNDDSQPLAIVGSDVFTYLAGGLTGETSYTFKIAARDYSGNLSAPLSNDVMTAVDNVLPTWPANAFLNAKDLKSDSFTLYWQAALDNIGIDHYNIYQDGEIIGSTADGTITEYPITGLEATTKYTFMVEAVDTSDNKTADKLIFEQSTTVSGPTEGAGIEFTMTSPANENVGKSGNAMLNRVTEPMLDANITFTFDFAKDLVSSTWLANVELVKNDDVENPIHLQAEYFSYTFAEGIGALKLEIPQNLVDMGTSYQLKLMSSFEAKDGSTLGKDYIWEFNVAQGLYGIKDIAAGVNSYSAWEAAADRFYLMVKSDGTVWGWGNNLYGHLGDGTTQDSAVPVQALNLQNITKVAAGVNSAFAVDADGGVWGWGSNEYGQLGKGTLPTGTSGRYGNETPQKIAGLPPIVKLVYGFNRCVALDVNGDVWTWGFRTSVYQSPYGVLSTGTPAKVPFLSNIKDVATGWQTSLAVTADGKVWEWAGIDGTPAEVDGLTEVKSVAMDSFNYTKNNMALKKDGTLWYWGEGTIVVTIPGPSNKLAVDLIQVEGAENVKEIYTKSMAVLTDDRSVRSVDVDFAAKTAILGDVISNLTDISKLAVYTTSSRTNPVSGGLALKLDGTLLQFIADIAVPIDPGMNAVDPPVWPDESALTFSNLTEQGLTLNWNSCGEEISAYAVYQDGSLVKTLPGDQLSYSIIGLTKGQAYTFKVEARLAGSSFTVNGPSASVTLTDWNPTMQGAGKIAAGTGHTLMIDAAGDVWAWGANDFGQLGIGNTEDQVVPVKIEDLSCIEAVAVGDSHSLALDGDGNVWVWGSNGKYQLGLGTTENSNVPAKLTSISGVTGISAAGNYNLAVKSDGTLWSWGEPCNANLYYAISGIDGKTPGQMKYGTPSPAINYYYQNVKSAAASPNFYAVLFADGTISRSGSFIDNVGAGTYWTMLYNPGLMGVQAISAGNDFLMALLEDGTVAVMGDNSQGQYGNGTRINPTPATAAAYKMVTGMDDVAAISAGGAHGLALKTDGSVWGWGRNDQGQLGNGNTITQLIPAGTIKISDIYALDAGNSFSIVLKDDTAANIEAYAFGDNSKGQLGTGSTTSGTVAKRIIFPGFVDTTVPTFPVWFAINVTWPQDNDQARIIWSEAEDDVGIAAYEIWQNNVKIDEVPGDTMSYTVTGLIAGQDYEFGIKARDAAGNVSVLSKTVNNADTIAPEWENAELTASDITKSSLTLTWSGAADNVGITSYNVYNGAALYKAVTGTTCEVTGLEAGTTYTFKVEAADAAGNLSTTGPSTNVTTKNSSGSTPGGGTPGDGSGSGDGAGAGTGTPGDLTVELTTFKTNPTDTILYLDFNKGMDDNLAASLALIKVYEKTSKNQVVWSDYEYVKSGNTDTGDKVRRLVLSFNDLKGSTTYVVELGAGVMSNNGSTLGVVKKFEFTTTASSFSGGGSAGMNSQGGTIKGEGMTLEIPSLALADTAKISLEKVGDTSGTPFASSSLLIGNVFRIDSDKDDDFLKPVKVTMEFDPNKADLDKYQLDLCYFDKKAKEWISLDNVKIDLENGKISGETTKLGDYAVIASLKAAVTQPETPAGQPAVELNDIADHWAKANIKELVAMGAISGYPDGSFAPDKGISRAEFALVLVKAFKLEAKEGKIFTDTAEHWAKDSIAAANGYGIISGYDDSTFGPDDIITREQMAVMIVKAAQLQTSNGELEFADRDQISSWAADAIAAAVQNQLISGYPDNTFRPGQGASRAEAVTVILKALKLGKA